MVRLPQESPGEDDVEKAERRCQQSRRVSPEAGSGRTEERPEYLTVYSVVRIERAVAAER